eukprot:g10627.t1
MANRAEREVLRGAEEEVFDILAEVLTSKQWAELLRAPLECAVFKGNGHLVKKLVVAGAEIGDAVHVAAGGDDVDVMSYLLENGAPVDAQESRSPGITPLRVAAAAGNAEMVQLLSLKGTDVDVMDNEGFSPLYLAVSNGFVSTALALMDAGADLSLRYGVFRHSVLHAAAEERHIDVMRVLIERGADVNAVDWYQWTPLHQAALLNRDETIDVLVEAGANIEARDDTGRTPLHCTASNRPHDALLALLKHGAHVNTQDNYQNTALHTAVSYAGTEGAAEVVDLLLRSGADETILNANGKTAADYLAANVYEEDQLADDVEGVRQLLANAPIDRAWRRRGYLVLCRAHPNRMQQAYASNSACEGVEGRTRNKAKLRRTQAIGCGGDVGASPVGGRTDVGWAEVTARVVGLQEEGIFRTIVGYL